MNLASERLSYTMAVNAGDTWDDNFTAMQYLHAMAEADHARLAADRRAAKEGRP